MWLELTEQVGECFRHKSLPQDAHHLVDQIRYLFFFFFLATGLKNSLIISLYINIDIYVLYLIYIYI